MLCLTCTGINTVLKSLTLGPGDVILTYEHTFIAVGYTCASVCAHNGCRRLTVPLRLPAADEPLLTADEIVEVTEKTLDLNRNVRIAIIGERPNCYIVNGSVFHYTQCYRSYLTHYSQ